MSIEKLLIRSCYHLKQHQKYQATKLFFRNLLTNPKSRSKVVFDIIMIILVISSVFLLIYAVRNSNPYIELFDTIVVSIFIIEYLLRLWVYNDNHLTIIEYYEKTQFLNCQFNIFHALSLVLKQKWAYATSPLAIIDLLSILPSYRPLRFLRIFLLFRVFKLLRYTRSVNEFLKVLSEKRFELYTLALFVSLISFVASTAIYIFEGDFSNKNIGGFFDAMYWAFVTISTVGYGDITPHSQEGRIVTILLIVTGLGVISFATSIIVSAFAEKMLELRKNRLYATAEKLRNHLIICGYGRISEVVAKNMSRQKHPLVIIESNPDKVDLAQQRGYLAILGDASNDILLKKIGISQQATTLLCATNDDVTNTFIALTARQLNPKLKIIARANRHTAIPKIYAAGANHVISPFATLGLLSETYIKQPIAFEAIYDLLSGKKEISVEAIIIQPNTFLAQQPLANFDFKQAHLIVLGVIPQTVNAQLEPTTFQLEQQHFYFNPPLTYQLQAGDILVLFGHRLRLNHLRDQLEKSRH